MPYYPYPIPSYTKSTCYRNHPRHPTVRLSIYTTPSRRGCTSNTIWTSCPATTSGEYPWSGSPTKRQSAAGDYIRYSQKPGQR